MNNIINNQTNSRMRFFYLLILYFSFFSFVQHSKAQCGWVGSMNYPSGAINEGSEYLAYIQVWKDGVTNAAGQGSGINCYVYFGTVSSFGGGWSNIQTLPMTYVSDAGNNDVYYINIGPYLSAGLVEYTCYGVCSGSPDQYWQSGSNAELTVNAPLPVKIFDISASETSNGNVVAWTTLSESNSDLFEIQFSYDAISYEVIGQMKSHGNTNSKNTYEFNHKLTKKIDGFYRLKQIDIDGNFGYSEVVALRSKISEFTPVIYPNPSQDMIMVKGLKAPSLFSIESISGQKSFSGSIEVKESIDISNLQAGLYILNIQDAKSNATMSFRKL